MDNLYFETVENVGGEFKYKEWKANVLYENVLVSRFDERTTNGRFYDRYLGDLAINYLPGPIPIVVEEPGSFTTTPMIGFAFNFAVYDRDLRCSLFFFKDCTGFSTVSVLTKKRPDADGHVDPCGLANILISKSCGFKVPDSELRKALNDALSTVHELHCQKEKLENECLHLTIENSEVDSCEDDDVACPEDD